MDCNDNLDWALTARGHSACHSTRRCSALLGRTGWTTHQTWAARRPRARTPWTIRSCLV